MSRRVARLASLARLVRSLHLRLHTRDLRHTEPRGLPSGVPQQRCLSDARLASHGQDGALTPTHVFQEPVEHLAFAGPVKQPEARLAAISQATLTDPRPPGEQL